MLQELTADALPLLCRQNVGMPNEIDIAHWLQAHNPCQRPIALVIAAECDAGCDLPVEIVHQTVFKCNNDVLLLDMRGTRPFYWAVPSEEVFWVIRAAILAASICVR
jgi:hypothetical protein